MQVPFNSLSSSSSDPAKFNPFYTFIVSTYEPAFVGDYELVIESERELTLRCLPDNERWLSSTVHGEWTAKSAGGLP